MISYNIFKIYVSRRVFVDSNFRTMSIAPTSNSISSPSVLHQGHENEQCHHKYNRIITYLERCLRYPLQCQLIHLSLLHQGHNYEQLPLQIQ